jgi:hypothetical protein
MSQLFMGMFYKAFLHFWTWYHIYTPNWPYYEEGVILPNDIFWLVEGHDPFPWMSIPHPTPLFACRLTLEHSQKINKSNVIRFHLWIPKSAWRIHLSLARYFSTICQNAKEWNNMPTKYNFQIGFPMSTCSNGIQFTRTWDPTQPSTSLLIVPTWCLTSKSYSYKMKAHLANFPMSQSNSMNHVNGWQLVTKANGLPNK